MTSFPYRLAPESREAINRSIFISGAARTGTSMMGNLFHTLKHVEYSYEPALLFSLMPMLDILEEDTWRFLYENYIFEDFLVNAIAGRNLNLNPHEESSVLHGKTRQEISARLSHPHRRHQDFSAIMRARIVVKQIDSAPFLHRLAALYPGMRVVAMSRNLESVSASLIAKGWFRDDEMTGFSNVWPYRQAGNLHVPVWVPENRIDEFIALSEPGRCCLYYIVTYGHLASLDQAIIIDYDAFKSSPDSMFKTLANRLNLSFGPLTTERLGGVREPEKNRAVVFDSVPKALLDEAVELSDLMRERSRRFFQD